MTAGNQAVKVTAKIALKGNWVRSITAVLCLMLAMYFSFMINSVLHTLSSVLAFVYLAVSSFFITAPLALGVIRFFWRLIHGAVDNPAICFYYFSKKELYLRAFKLIFSLAVKALGFGLFIYFPVVLIKILSNEFIYELLNMPTPMWTTNLESVLVFLTTLVTVILFFIMLRYYSAVVLTVMDDSMDIAEAIHISVTISKGSLLDFIYLFFSFLGWILLSMFFIPQIFILPYMLASYVVHVRFAIADYNKQIKQLNSDDYPSYSVGV